MLQRLAESAAETDGVVPARPTGLCQTKPLPGGAREAAPGPGRRCIARCGGSGAPRMADQQTRGGGLLSHAREAQLSTVLGTATWDDSAWQGRSHGQCCRSSQSAASAQPHGLAGASKSALKCHSSRGVCQQWLLNSCMKFLRPATQQGEAAVGRKRSSAGRHTAAKAALLYHAASDGCCGLPHSSRRLLCCAMRLQLAAGRCRGAAMQRKCAAAAPSCTDTLAGALGA